MSASASSTRRFAGHWDELGEGPPMICLPGFANSNWIFQKMFPALTPHFRLILPDHRGMGRSPTTTAPYSIADLATDARELMDALGHERFLVLGLSMGGFVAQHLVLAAPERVTGLALLCTTAGGPEFQRIFPVMSADQVRAIYLLEPQERARLALDPTLLPRLHAEYPALYQFLVEMRSRNPENVAEVMRQYEAVADFLAHPLPLESIRAPTLILAGEQDRLVPLENAELLHAKIPGSRLEVIPETDHMFFLEKPEATATILRDFLITASR
ncbi:MAG: alpha/beta fold hydrolase [Magnetococcales bacterium]|nr:alpha/beta fold hydrolase [Magnetococcales bacterium]MBF0156580.1 alpha/beta fold hydrolase [Magnetococcales bacterium]